jgi:hypothetical protein
MTDTAGGNAPPGAPDDTPVDWVPVERRFLGFDKATIVPTILILILVLALGTWLPNINKAISYDNQAKAGDVLDLGEGITITPVPGWNIVKGLRLTEEPVTGRGESETTVTLVNGAVTLEVVRAPFDGTTSELLDQVNHNNELLKDNQGFHVTSAPATATTSQGDEGLFQSYTGTDTEGITAAFVFGTQGVKVTAVGPQGAVRDQANDIATMIDSLNYEPQAAS